MTDEQKSVIYKDPPYSSPPRVTIPKDAPMVLADFPERYSRAIDAAFRTIEKEIYGRVWEDEVQHTSEVARVIAMRVFEAIGVPILHLGLSDRMHAAALEICGKLYQIAEIKDEKERNKANEELAEALRSGVYESRPDEEN